MMNQQASTNKIICMYAREYICILPVGSDCTRGSFSCGSEGACISEKRICDGVRDCSDGRDEDESACGNICSSTLTTCYVSEVCFFRSDFRLHFLRSVRNSRSGSPLSREPRFSTKVQTSVARGSAYEISPNRLCRHAHLQQLDRYIRAVC